MEKKESFETLTWDEYIPMEIDNLLSDLLHDKPLWCTGQELATKLTQRYFSDISIWPYEGTNRSRELSIKYIKHFWNDAADFFDYINEDCWMSINPFKDPEQFACLMADKSIRKKLAETEYIRDNWDTEIEFTEAVADTIRSQLELWPYNPDVLPPWGSEHFDGNMVEFDERFCIDGANDIYKLCNRLKENVETYLMTGYAEHNPNCMDGPDYFYIRVAETGDRYDFFADAEVEIDDDFDIYITARKLSIRWNGELIYEDNTGELQQDMADKLSEVLAGRKLIREREPAEVVTEKALRSNDDYDM